MFIRLILFFYLCFITFLSFNMDMPVFYVDEEKGTNHCIIAAQEAYKMTGCISIYL